MGIMDKENGNFVYSLPVPSHCRAVCDILESVRF